MSFTYIRKSNDEYVDTSNDLPQGKLHLAYFSEAIVHNFTEEGWIQNFRMTSSAFQKVYETVTVGVC